jgi:maleylacetate reductase
MMASDHSRAHPQPREVAALGASRVMVIASKREIGHHRNLRVVLRHDHAAMHVPADVAARAREVAARHNIDTIISVGGGSTTGLAKAIALTTGLPVGGVLRGNHVRSSACLPTWCAGVAP